MTETLTDVVNQLTTNNDNNTSQRDVPSQKEVYRLKDVCSDGGFGQSTAWKYIKKGRIKTFKMGNRVCITAHERQRILTEGF